MKRALRSVVLACVWDDKICRKRYSEGLDVTCSMVKTMTLRTVYHAYTSE